MCAYASIENFLDTLCVEDQAEAAYIPGNQAIDFYPSYLRVEHRIAIEEHVPDGKPKPFEFEEALLARLGQSRPFGLLFLVGGLGSGKTTTVKYLLRSIKEKRAEFHARFNCACAAGGCHRDPIYVDGIRFSSLTDDPSELARLIFHEIRLQVYKRLIDTWLLSLNVNPSFIHEHVDSGYHVLRRLLLANDILPKNGLYFARGYPTGPLRLERPLLQMKPENPAEWIAEAVSRYTTAADLLAEAFEEIRQNLAHSREFLAGVLRMYIEPCKINNPTNLIVIDNLDALPTAKLEVLISLIHTVASTIGGVPFLVPVRPSSIAPGSVVRNLACRYHYGPNNFELTLQRLERHILTKSPEAILQDASWQEPVSIEDRWRFVLAAVIYAQVLEAGLRMNRPKLVVQDAGTATLVYHEADNPSRQVKMHPEFSRITNAITLNANVLDNLSRTVSALVGCCARYALSEMNRFFSNCFIYGGFLDGMIHELKKSRTLAPVRIPYGSLVALTVANPQRPFGALAHQLNLFMPLDHRVHHGQPTLARLRILEHLLRHPRVTINALLADLSLHGLPKEGALLYLNDLQDRKRLLIWFSDNQSLTNTSSLDQYSVLSEHGLGYLLNIVGNFEYLWHASAEISGGAIEVNFPQKLSYLSSLLERLAEVEWLQICLRSGSASEIETQRTGVGARPFLTLMVAYGVLEHVVPGMELVLKRHHGAEYSQALNKQVDVILRLIGDLQYAYVVAHGNAAYVIRHQVQISAALSACDQLIANGLLQERTQKVLQLLIDGWQDEAESLATSSQGLPFIAKTRYERKSTIEEYRYLRKELVDLLGSRLPTRQGLEIRVTSLNLLIDSVEREVEEGKLAIEEAELRSLRSDSEALRVFELKSKSSSYSIRGSLSAEEVEAAKDRCNAWLAAMDEVGSRLGVRSRAHFGARWQ